MQSRTSHGHEDRIDTALNPGFFEARVCVCCGHVPVNGTRGNDRLVTEDDGRQVGSGQVQVAEWITIRVTAVCQIRGLSYPVVTKTLSCMAATDSFAFLLSNFINLPSSK